MNYAMIFSILGYGMLVEAALMGVSLIVGLLHQESSVWTLALTMAILAVVGFGMTRVRAKSRKLYAREGFVIVALMWVVMTGFGALPFVLCGVIPNYIDAYFEIMSGFTTTGASVITDLDAVPRGLMFWRCMTQWIGGMGVLVFMMAILPSTTDSSIHLMRAEVPGPTKDKLVPRMRSTALTLYMLYFILSAVLAILLRLGGMPWYEAVTYTFNTAATGGFGVTNSGLIGYNSVYVEVVITVFMLLFGVNFYCYYLVLMGRWKKAIVNEELHWYLGIALGMMLLVSLSAMSHYDNNFFTSLRYGSFTVSSLMTTTGFATADYNLWPQVARTLILFVMLLGGCAGSTAGGPKTARLLILWRAVLRELRQMIRPRSVQQVRMDGKALDEDTVRVTLIYMVAHMFILALSCLLVSFNNFPPEETFAGVLSCFNNVGPGLGASGPMGSYANYSYFSKIVLILDMLLGRLEIFPVLLASMSLSKRVRSYH